MHENTPHFIFFFFETFRGGRSPPAPPPPPPRGAATGRYHQVLQLIAAKKRWSAIRIHTQRVSIKAHQLLRFFFFWETRNRHKSLVRIYNDIIAFTRFLFCVIWTFGSKTTANFVKSLWIYLAGWSAIDHILFSSWKITILQSIFMLHDLRVQSKIQYCDPIE